MQGEAKHHHPPLNVYTLKLDQRFILFQCLDICAVIFPRELAYLRSNSGIQLSIETENGYNKLVQHSSGLLEPSLPELERRLASGTYLTPAKINRRDFSISVIIAKRIHMQLSMGDPALPEVIAYWLELTRTKHRPLRHSATALLWRTVSDALSSLDDRIMMQRHQMLHDLVQYIWTDGLQRACTDVNIHLRARCLTMAGKFCNTFPETFWSSAIADIFLQGTCDKTKTVRTESLRQLVDISRNRDLVLDSADTFNAWVSVFLIYARKQQRHHVNARCLGLLGLQAMCTRASARVIDLDTAKNLLMLCLNDNEPLDTIKIAVNLVWIDFNDEATFKVVFDFSLRHTDRSEILGEALVSLEPESFVMCVMSMIHQKTVFEEAQLRVILGSSKCLNDCDILQLTKGLLALKAGEPHHANDLRHLYATSLLEKVCNKQVDGYFEALVLAENYRAADESQYLDRIGHFGNPESANVLNGETPGMQMSPSDIANNLLTSLKHNSSDSLRIFKMLIASLNDVDLSISGLKCVMKALTTLYQAVCQRERPDCRVLKFPRAPLYRALQMAAEKHNEKSDVEALKSSIRLLEELDVLGDNVYE